MPWGPINLAAAPVDGFDDALKGAVGEYQKQALDLLDQIKANMLAAAEANAQAHLDAPLNLPLVEGEGPDAAAEMERVKAEQKEARQAEAEQYLESAKAAVEEGHQARLADLNESDHQMEVATAAAGDIVASRALGSGTVNVIINGHAAPGHEPTPGENSRISVVIACADHPPLGE